MHIVVCIKQVPDSAQIRVHPVTNTIMRQGVPAIVNPYDLFSLEEALRLKDKFGGKVTMLGNIVQTTYVTNLPFAAAVATIPVVIVLLYLLAVRRSGALDSL